MDGGAPAAPTHAALPPPDGAPSAPAPLHARAKILRQFELVERVRAYDPQADEALINRAYVFATAMHGSQRRHSGDPYFAHPIQVAGILTEYKLDTQTIVAGLLHDTLEDTVATPEQIEGAFGAHILALVEGVTKLSKLEELAENERQAGSLQKFILAMSKDVRVLLVKLADRLHNMRTIQHIPTEAKRRRIALETLEIYAPLSRRIGMEKMAAELEDLSFPEAFPDAAAAIQRRLETLRLDKGKSLSLISERIYEMLMNAGLDARVLGREKQPYSIWRKMQRKNVGLADLADIHAFRVIVADADDCYRALGLIHRAWRCVPEALEDYISNPKPNGYRSIHTIVIGPGNARVEIQIRSDEMDQLAEAGVAAHWRYKNNSYGFDAEQAASMGLDPRETVRSLLEIAEHGGDPEEFMEHAKLDLYQDHVFTFTPKGALIDLPQGATPLDFAYAVHSHIGDTCVGAVINGDERPLRTQLRNGDVVEIVCGDAPAPVPGWESLTKTGRAKSHQRRLERIARREEFLKLGRELVAHALHRYGRDLAETSLDDTAKRLGEGGVDDLFIAVGEGSVKSAAVAAAAFPQLAERIRKDEERKPMEERKARLYVRGSGLTPGVSLHFGECCTPIPGDRIVGVQEQGRGVIVHTIDCETLAAHEGSMQWIDLGWTEAALDHALATGRIEATVENGRGVLAGLCMIIAENEGNILNIRTKRRSADFFDLVFDIEVTDAKHLTNILAAMRTSRAVRGAERVRG
ncbi:MAG: RelA/SpoT family protein [Alphaproteobacteria bacterium]|nr:RelA/SpoT family protein [Alphaproteobacteria bacterium]